ncbi:unnamed protein product [Auanema sp. JU1783]|nr:unnamed protein product [Auanema sp. JU1783]
MSPHNLHKVLEDPEEATEVVIPTYELYETSYQPNDPEKLFERHIWIPILLMALISLIPVIYFIKWIVNRILDCCRRRRGVPTSEVTGRDDGQTTRRMRMIKGCVQSETVDSSMKNDDWEHLEEQLLEFAESFKKMEKKNLQQSTEEKSEEKEESSPDSTEDIVATNDEVNGVNRLMALEKFPRYQ